jgi:hypothetical protein
VCPTPSICTKENKRRVTSRKQQISVLAFQPWHFPLYVQSGCSFSAQSVHECGKCLLGNRWPRINITKSISQIRQILWTVTSRINRHRRRAAYVRTQTFRVLLCAVWSRTNKRQDISGRIGSSMFLRNVDVQSKYTTSQQPRRPQSSSSLVQLLKWIYSTQSVPNSFDNGRSVFLSVVERREAVRNTPLRHRPPL